MRWKKISNLVVALMLTIAYVYVTLLNLLAPLHAHLVHLEGPTLHPVMCFGYLLVASVITWTIYLYPQRNSTRASFFFALAVGIALIVAGIFMWDIAAKIEDTVIATQQH